MISSYLRPLSAHFMSITHPAFSPDPAPLSSRPLLLNSPRGREARAGQLIMLVTEAFLGSLFVQTFIYGISTATYFECMRTLVVNADTYRASTGMRRLLTVVSSLMFAVSHFDSHSVVSEYTTG
jgi:hypothetical protein